MLSWWEICCFATSVSPPVIYGGIELVAVAESASDMAEEKIVVKNYAGTEKKKKFYLHLVLHTV